MPQTENKAVVRYTQIVAQLFRHGEHPDWKWRCTSCGTLTNDGECDCTGFPESADLQVLIRNP